MSLKKFITDFEEAMEEMEPGLISGTTAFKELKSWDSLAVLTVTDVIEMEYGVLLTKKNFESVTTIEELYQIVQEKQ